MNKHDSDWYIPQDWFCILGMSILPVVIAVLASMILTANLCALYGVGLGAGVWGSAMLWVARLPLYKQRRFWTIGPMQLDRKHRRIYWLAYVFVAVSLLLLGIVWLRAHGN
jgi:hypothetical protein